MNECQNCSKLWEGDELEPIQNIGQRVEAGEPMPSGECPDCGALCQPLEGEVFFQCELVTEQEAGNPDDAVNYAVAAAGELNWIVTDPGGREHQVSR